MVVESVCGVTQSLIGQNPEQPAAADPAPGRGVGLDGFRRSLATSNTIGFYDFFFICIHNILKTENVPVL